MIPSKERTGYISEGEPVFTSCLTSQSTTHTRLAQPPVQVSGWSVSKGHPTLRNLCKSQLTFNAKCKHLSYQGWHHIQPFEASKATCSRCCSAGLTRAWRLQEKVQCFLSLEAGMILGLLIHKAGPGATRKVSSHCSPPWVQAWGARNTFGSFTKRPKTSVC